MRSGVCVKCFVLQIVLQHIEPNNKILCELRLSYYTKLARVYNLVDVVHISENAQEIWNVLVLSS